MKAAINNYNLAAAALRTRPPIPELSWEEVVHYAFLSDFDLLRESREDIRQKPWAKPAGRLAMDRYFKIQRAKEEIQRLNVEIRRLVTYIRDEDRYLHQKVEEWGTTDASIAFQIEKHRRSRARFNDRHLRRLVKLSAEPGFTGCISPGVCFGSPHLAEEPEHADMGQDETVNIGIGDSNDWEDVGGDDDDGLDEDEDDEELAEQFMAMVQISND